MPIRRLFPTLVYEAPLIRDGDRRFRRELLEECLQIREIDDEGREWCAANYPDGYTSYASMCRLHRSSSTFAALEGRLRRHVTSFARSLDYDLGDRTLEMTDCWVNIMERHCSHDLHLHPTSTISGTYYVKTPRGASGLKLEDPRLANMMASPPRTESAREANQSFVTYAASAGNVVLFESWLRHSVPPSRIDGERVSVSFNFNWF